MQRNSKMIYKFCALSTIIYRLSAVELSWSAQSLQSASLSCQELKKQLEKFIQPLRLEQRSVRVNKQEKLGSGSFGGTLL